MSQVDEKKAVLSTDDAPANIQIVNLILKDIQFGSQPVARDCTSRRMTN